MVWWMDKNECNEECRVYDKYDIQEDRIFQNVNVMFNFVEEFVDTYDIRALLKSGINIFNVDITFLKETTLKVIGKAVKESGKLPEMFPEPIYRPVSLAVTMSVEKPVKMDNEVTIIILKDVSNRQQIIDFKQSHKDINLHTLIWISKFHTQDTIIKLIQGTNGIVLDYSLLSEKYCDTVTEICKKQRKPIFGFKPEVWEDISAYKGSRRKLLVVASEIVKSGVDGIIMNGGKDIMEHTKVLRHIVEAMRVAEHGLNPEIEFERFRKQLETPLIAPMTVAIAASLTALKCGAAAIMILTSTGKTARLVSWAAPPCHILAVTKNESVAKQMHLYRKVIPFWYEGARVSSWQKECRRRVFFGAELGTSAGLLRDGAKLVVLAPSAEGIGYCDTVFVATIPFRCDE